MPHGIKGSTPACSIPDCSRLADGARGWCHIHYMRWWRLGDPLAEVKPANIRGPLAKRLMGKFLVGDGCWEWIASKDWNGYGRIGTGGKTGAPHLAHRAVYELLEGPIPDGLELDHLCRNHSCVKPSHLEPVTKRENMLRGESPASKNARATHCQRGHEWNAANTYRTPQGGRRCRECRRTQIARSRVHRLGVLRDLETPGFGDQPTYP